MTHQISIRSVIAILMVAMHFTQICGYRAFDQNIILGGKGASSKPTGVTPQPQSKEATATATLPKSPRSREAKAAPPAVIAPHTHAFSHNYLTGFHLSKMKLTVPMQWHSESNTLDIGGDTYLTGHAAEVTRKELVPQVSEKDVRQSQIPSSKPGEEALGNIKLGDSAKYFAYVRFFETRTGVQKDGEFRYGGFVYFASEAHKNAGLPMEHMNILEKNRVGTMRFKFGYEAFWQLAIPSQDYNEFNFAPDVSKELSQRFQAKTKTFSINIPRVITWSWFNKGSPGDDLAVDKVEFEFNDAALREGLSDGYELGKCSVADHHEFGKMPIYLAPHDEGPLEDGGMPGDAGTRWYPVTIPEMLDAGARHYTWVMPKELGNGGFMYHMLDQDEQSYFIYFEMLSLLCKELEQTAYDRWMSTWVSGGAYAAMLANYRQWKPTTKQHTLVFVIDMQNDFIGMSFQMPCARKRTELVSQLDQFVRKQFEGGATIVASLDYHPKNHCGVLGDCSNGPGPFMTYEGLRDENNTYENMPSDAHFYQGPGATNGRYIKNGFPPHCEWFPGKGGRSIPSEGAHLFPVISTMLHDFAVEDNSRVHTVFKGFNRTKESFSALPTYEPTSGSPEDFTGGYAVSGGDWGIGDGRPDVYRPWPKECYGFLAEDARQLAKEVPDWCFPMVDQLKAPEQKNNFMWRVDDVLEWIEQKHGPVDQVIITGLVFDFCVKETAFNALKKFPGKVIVPFELARPACEGGPLEDYIFPPAGLGTPAIIERTEKEYRARGINLVQTADIER